jgi:hypothetical protein
MARVPLGLGGALQNACMGLLLAPRAHLADMDIPRVVISPIFPLQG